MNKKHYVLLNTHYVGALIYNTVFNGATCGWANNLETCNMQEEVWIFHWWPLLLEDIYDLSVKG